MKAHLMFEDEDFAFDVAFSPRTGYTISGPDLPPNANDLVQDLELVTLLSAMARGDSLLFGISKRALLSGLTDPREITYRLDVLADCITHPEIVQEGEPMQSPWRRSRRSRRSGTPSGNTPPTFFIDPSRCSSCSWVTETASPDRR